MLALRHKTFQLLLRQLGFHLPSETGKLFFRIPSFWTPDVLLTVAYKLGPIHPGKFSDDNIFFSSIHGSLTDLLIKSCSVDKPLIEEVFENKDNRELEPVQHFHASRATLVNYTPMYATK